MIGYVRFQKNSDDKDEKSYHCSRCGAFIADSGAIISIQGAKDHSFVNPAGVLCNFTTFAHCHNVLVDKDLYLRHSWFSGYGWRYVMCGACMQHLGWHYDAVRKGARPRSFFGILVETVDSVGQGQ